MASKALIPGHSTNFTVEDLAKEMFELSFKYEEINTLKESLT